MAGENCDSVRQHCQKNGRKGKWCRRKHFIVTPPCRIGHTQEVKRLIESGVNINHMNVLNQTGLMMAVSGGHNNIVQLFLCQPEIDLTVQSLNDNTVLHEAVEANNVDALHMLLDHPGRVFANSRRARAHSHGHARGYYHGHKKTHNMATVTGTLIIF